MLRFSLETFVIDTKESEVCKGLISGAVVCGADIQYLKSQLSFTVEAKKGQGPSLLQPIPTL